MYERSNPPVVIALLAVLLFGVSNGFGDVESLPTDLEPESEPATADAPESPALEDGAAEEVDGVPVEDPAHAGLRMSTMNMPSVAPFGASQRGLPPIVNVAHPSLSDRGFRFGTLFDIGAGVEIGEAKDFDQRIDDILDAFDRLEEQAEDFSGPRPSDPEIQAFLDDLNLFENQANDLVRDLTDDAYVKLTGSASAPLVPIAFRSNLLRGVVGLYADGIIEARAAVESVNDAFDIGLQGVAANEVDRFEIIDDTPVVVLTDGTERPIEPTDDAGVAVQGGYVGRIGAGYSRQVWSRGEGRLHAGTSFNIFRTTLVRGGVLLNDDEFEDTARDEFEENQETSSGLGLDIGATWVERWYSLGATLRNINEPSFDYPDTSDSAFFTANPQARRNGSRWTIERQLTLEGAVYTPSRRWMATAALDLNSAKDTTGDNYKWAAILGSYEPRRGWVPSPRVGMKTNLAGEKLTYVAGGLTFFRALHLDVASTLDTTSIDGTSVPRGLQANIALGRRF